MAQETRDKEQEQRLNSYRKFGSAKSRYVNDSEIDFREQVSQSVKKRIKQYNQKHSITGNEYYKKKAERLERQSARYRYCGYEYVLIKCTGCDQSYIGASRCESRICPDCARKHGARIRSKQIPLVKELPLDGKKRLGFVTLTKKTDPSRPLVDHDLKQLNQQARKLFNEFYPKKYNCGAFSNIEVGDNENLHIHALVFGYYVSQKRLSERWKEITGDSDIVDIRTVTSPIKAVNYLLKYISKPPKFTDPDKMAEFLDVITGIRRVHTYGIFYNYPLMRKKSTVCAFCGDRLKFTGTDGGLNIPLNAVLFSEIFNLNKEN